MYERCGCKECLNLGTTGRLPIFEFLHLGKELKALIRQPFDEVAFRECWIGLGGQSLALDGLKRVAEGLTPYIEIAKYDEDYIPDFS